MKDKLEEYGLEGWDRRPRLRIVGDAISQLGNSILPGGSADESLSGRSYRVCILQQGGALWFWRAVRWIAEALFWIWDRGSHTQLAFWEDVYRCRARARALDYIAPAIELQTWGAGDSLPAEQNPNEEA